MLWDSTYARIGMSEFSKKKKIVEFVYKNKIL